MSFRPLSSGPISSGPLGTVAGPAAGRPDPPTIGTATAGNGQATVTFTAPVNPGMSAIIDYTVTSSPGGLTATGASSPLTVTGLTNGTGYTFKVTARNTQGSSDPSSDSNSVTPSTIPGTPTGVTATVTGKNSVSVTATVSNGGSAITSYVVTPSTGGSFSSATLPVTVTGLTMGRAVTFTMHAVNANGTGGESAGSAAVYPFPAFTAYGDSNTTNPNAHDATVTSWVNRLSTALGLSVTNRAVSGAQLIDQSRVAFTNTVTAGSFVDITTNDQRTGGYGADATKKARWQEANLALLAHLCFPTKTWAQQASVVTGTWTDVATVLGGDKVRSTTTNGAKLNYSNIIGRYAYVIWFYQDGQTGTWKLQKDGVDMGITGTVAPGAVIGSTTISSGGSNFMAAAVRIDLGDTSPHTIGFVSTGTGLCYSIAVIGVGNQASLNEVWIADAKLPNTTGLASFGVDAPNVQDYTTMIVTNVGVVTQSGGHAYVVPIQGEAFDYAADGLHQTNTGEQQEADIFEDEMIFLVPFNVAWAARSANVMIGVTA
jgi:hypothetical protein